MVTVVLLLFIIYVVYESSCKLHRLSCSAHAPITAMAFISPFWMGLCTRPEHCGVNGAGDVNVPRKRNGIKEKDSKVPIATKDRNDVKR